MSRSNRTIDGTTVLGDPNLKNTPDRQIDLLYKQQGIRNPQSKILLGETHAERRNEREVPSRLCASREETSA